MEIFELFCNCLLFKIGLKTQTKNPRHAFSHHFFSFECFSLFENARIERESLFYCGLLEH